MTTYDRKYFLIREVKKLGFRLSCKENERTIYVPYHKQNEAKQNKHIKELLSKYQYGVQITL